MSTASPPQPGWFGLAVDIGPADSIGLWESRIMSIFFAKTDVRSMRTMQ